MLMEKVEQKLLYRLAYDSPSPWDISRVLRLSFIDR